MYCDVQTIFPFSFKKVIHEIIFSFSFFVITSFSASAQFKPEAMILPITFLNFNDTALQESLDNFVQTELSRNFEIKSEDEVAEALEKAIDEMDSETCTQEACIKNGENA